MRYSSKQIVEDAQVNMNLRTVKRLKAKIRENGSITRDPGSWRRQKLIEAHRSFIYKLITDLLIIPEIGLQSNYEIDMALKLIGRLSWDY